MLRIHLTFMRRSPTTILAAAISLLAINGCCEDGAELCRRDLVELKACDENGVCEARWAGTQAWSQVFPSEEIEALPTAEPPWDCDPEPDVDRCVATPMGVVGCFRIENDYAVPVAPDCAPGTDGPEWIDIGNDMVALTHHQGA